MEIRLKKAETQGDILAIAEMAYDIWRESYGTILSAEQIEYMLDKFQSYRAIHQQIEEQNYIYYFIMRDNASVGYAAVQAEPDKLFLSKLYLRHEARNQGYGKAVVQQLLQTAKETGLSAVRLTVNRYNESAITAYTNMGFTVSGAQVADIGNGYVMDDFLMELPISADLA